MPRKLSIEKLNLKEFRNYSDLDLAISDGIVTITGPNGIGKTNILEAISLLIPGRGLRGARVTEFDNINQDIDFKINWQIKASVNSKQGPKLIEISRSATKEDSERAEKIIKIDGEVLKSKANIAQFMSIVWLTPQMDFLFIGSASDRRKFIDKITSCFDVEHGARLNKYEHYMRERLKLLKDGFSDKIWLSNIEQNMAEYASAICAARFETLFYLNSAMQEIENSFLKASLSMCGSAEDIYKSDNALAAEQNFREILENSRSLDAVTNRTNHGPHLSDLVVINNLTNMKANNCSTGEQKSLLISIILAEIKAQIKWHNITPIILLDDIVSHLDKFRRDALIYELLAENAQIFISCANSDELATLKGKSQNIALDHILKI